MKYKNNPFNIRFNHLNHWKGLLGNDRGFCTFMSLNYGIRTAAYLLMISYRKRGKRTYAELIETFAPSLENPTFKYVQFVTDRLGKFPLMFLRLGKISLLCFITCGGLNKERNLITLLFIF